MAKKIEEVKDYCCTNCDVQIIDPMKKAKARFLETYREHEMELSNDSLIRVAVCADCKSELVAGGKPAQEIADYILERHKVWWEKNLDNLDPRMPKFHEHVVVLDTDSNPVKFLNKVAERNAEKTRVREWQTEKAEFEKEESKRNKILDSKGEEMKVAIPTELENYEEWKKKRAKNEAPVKDKK